MTPLFQPSQPRLHSSKKMILDCREMPIGKDSFFSLQSVLLWVRSFPQPQQMHVLLPSSAPHMRVLQFALQGLGCQVSRVTNVSSVRL